METIAESVNMLLPVEQYQDAFQGAEQRRRRLNPLIRAVAFVGAASLIGCSASVETGHPETPPRAPVASVNGAVATKAIHHNGTMFVFGDSITAHYGATATAPNGEGWWAEVATEIGLKPVTSAISGTGFKRQSQDCTAPNYAERLTGRKAQQALKVADVVVIEGGRNDYHKCVDGKSVRTTPYDVYKYSKQFFEAILRYHTDPTSIYVMTPWGPKFPQYRTWIVPMVEKNAEALGLNWVDTTGVLTHEDTIDDTHPNADGNSSLCKAVLGNSDIKLRAAQVMHGSSHMPTRHKMTSSTCYPTE